MQHIYSLLAIYMLHFVYGTNFQGESYEESSEKVSSRQTFNPK
jgi:hypothetical protein